MDYFNEELDDYFNNPDSLDISMPHDEHDDYQRIQEELYQRAFDVEFEKATNVQNMFSADKESSVTKELTLSKTETPIDKKKKRKRNIKDDPILEITNKRRKSDVNDENTNKDNCKNQIPDDVSTTKKNKKPKTPSKNQSLKEVVEDAGLTMDDLQIFIDDKNSDDGNMIDLTSNPSSEYITVSETSDNETMSEYEDDSSNENINVNIVNHSRSRDDIALSMILNSLPDNGSWNISSSDIIGQSSSCIPRFHNMMKKIRCSNCNERGHQKYLCPQPKKVIKCILCGDSGHLHRNCPDQLCFRCDQPGHSKGDCRERIANYHDRCKRCFVRGHFEERCPDAWRQYHLTTTGSKVLRERDLKEKKNVEGRNKRRSCYNCGETGHLGHTCQESRMDKFQVTCTPYIFRYDSEKNVKGVDSEEEPDIDESIEIEEDERSTVKNRSRRKTQKHNEEFKVPKSIFVDTTVTDVEFETSKSQRRAKDSSHKKDSSKKNRKRKMESSMTDYSYAVDDDFENQSVHKSKSLNVIPLMNITIPDFSSTPLARNPKKLKLIEPASFPREDVSSKYTPANSRKRSLSFISPIVNQSESFSDLDASPERQIDSYHMGELNLQSSYYGKEQMKKARKKQAKKEKKFLLKEQQQAMKDKNPRKAQQWWSVPKSQQHELANEMNGFPTRRNRANNSNFERTINTQLDNNNDVEFVFRKKDRRRKSNNMSRGFKMGTFP